MKEFQLTSEYQPTGDQPEAIRELCDGIARGDKSQVLLGVTGSGKTFTIANVIAQVNKPTLILSHNKTLAAQLYEEMRGFFPNNAVEYYVGSQYQRGDRPLASLRRLFPTLRKERRGGCFVCIVYLWYGRSGGHGQQRDHY